MAAAEKPIVSLVVQTHNHERFVEDALTSLLLQDTVVPYEVVVVDDASTDNTWSEICRFSSRVRAIQMRHNTGAAASFNVAYATTSGSYVARLDGDDRWRMNYLDRTLRTLQAHPDASLAYGNICVIDAEGCAVEERPGWVHALPLEREQQLKDVLLRYCVPAPTILARRSAWDCVMPVRSNFGNSFDWAAAVAMNVHGPFVYIDDVLADYRLHTHNDSRKAVSDCNREHSNLHVLDALFAALPPSDWPVLHRDRAAIYAHAYRFAAASYNRRGMRHHALRCLAQAARRQPNLAAARAGLSVLVGGAHDLLRRS